MYRSIYLQVYRPIHNNNDAVLDWFIRVLTHYRLVYSCTYALQTGLFVYLRITAKAIDYYENYSCRKRYKVHNKYNYIKLSRDAQNNLKTILGRGNIYKIVWSSR